MEIYIPTTNKELSQRKLEEYEKFEKILNAGRQNPIWFSEEFFGIKLMDYQKWCFMKSWNRPYVVWLQSRGAGKTTMLAVFLMAKLLLIPDSNWYIFANSQQQSVESFLKLENLALQRIPSFKTCTDIFSHEIYRSQNSETGFLHNPAGYTCRLFNNSSLTTLSSNLTTVRGKRGSVAYDEVGFQNAEALSTVDNFANVDTNFGLGVNKTQYIEPVQMPLQLLYASSAGDVSYPFYQKYNEYSKKMFLGNNKFFVCDVNVDVLMNNSTVDGFPIKSHITQETVDKQIADDPDLAERELYNKFRKGAGKDAVIKMDTIIANTTVRKPMLFNETGKDKFILCYDPARNYDGSIVTVFRIIDDPKDGYKLELVNCRAMIDSDTAKKTPLPMPEQLKIIKKMMTDYNGDRAAEWENVHIYIDSGAGGGGVSGVADSLMEDWIGEDGKKHRGLLDKEHKQYQTSRIKYSNASNNITLIDPKMHKVPMFDALEKMSKLGLINFPDYDGKQYILLFDKNGEAHEEMLSMAEEMALIQCHLLKNEAVYMCRYETAGGGVSYDLDRDKKNKMHDDRAFTLAMGAYVLSNMRRKELITIKQNDIPPPLCVSAVTF